MGDAGGSAGRLMMPLNVVPVSYMTMTDMGIGCDRHELNGDQEDRRANHSQQCSGPSHAQLLLYDPGQGNNECNCGKCIVIVSINGRIDR